MDETAKPAGLLRFLPGVGHLARARGDTLLRDAVAGATLAAYLLPAGLGDASLAGLPPEAGLYACAFSGLVFWLFCTSRHTVITVTSAISLLVGTSLGELSGGDPARHAALAAGAAVIVFALGLAAFLVRAGSIVNFISESVLVGFKCGVALHIAASQLPKLLGYSGGHGDFFERAAHAVEHFGDTNGAALAFGAGALAVLVLGKVFLPTKPVSLLVVAGGIAVASFIDMDGAARGVSLLGPVPGGMPPLHWPPLGRADWNELLPIAMACFLLGTVETAAIGRTFASKHGYRYEPNQELLALAGSNLAAGLALGFPVSGGMSQSLVNEGGGARTPLSGLFAALLTLTVAVFFSGALQNLPQPVLAAIVLVAVAGLVKVKAMKRIFRFSRTEFLVMAVALAGVLASGILRGVLIGAALSVLLLLRRAARPRTTELGRVPGTDYFADAERHAENERDADTFVFRSEGGLLYFNAEWVRDRFFERLDARAPGVRLAVFFMGSVPIVDLAGADLLAELHRALRERGVAFRVAEARGQVREALRSAGFDREHGPLEEGDTVDSVIRAFRAGGREGGLGGSGSAERPR